MRATAILLILLALGGCTANFKPDPDLPQREQIVQVAMHQVGVPYRYAGADPDEGFDCSGLIYYSYGQVGLKIPRSTGQQITSGRRIPYADARPGDLMFYDFEGKSPNKLHVVLLTGPGTGVHAPGTGRDVTTARLDIPAWTSHYVGSVNLLPDAIPIIPPLPLPAQPPMAIPQMPAQPALEPAPEVITQIPDDPMAAPVFETAVEPEPAPSLEPEPRRAPDPITPPRAVEPQPAPGAGDNSILLNP